MKPPPWEQLPADLRRMLLAYEERRLFGPAENANAMVALLLTYLNEWKPSEIAASLEALMATLGKLAADWVQEFTRPYELGMRLQREKEAQAKQQIKMFPLGFVNEASRSDQTLARSIMSNEEEFRAFLVKAFSSDLEKRKSISVSEKKSGPYDSGSNVQLTHIGSLRAIDTVPSVAHTHTKLPECIIGYARDTVPVGIAKAAPAYGPGIEVCFSPMAGTFPDWWSDAADRVFEFLIQRPDVESISVVSDALLFIIDCENRMQYEEVRRRYMDRADSGGYGLVYRKEAVNLSKRATTIFARH